MKETSVLYIWQPIAAGSLRVDKVNKPRKTWGMCAYKWKRLIYTSRFRTPRRIVCSLPSSPLSSPSAGWMEFSRLLISTKTRRPQKLWLCQKPHSQKKSRKPQIAAGTLWAPRNSTYSRWGGWSNNSCAKWLAVASLSLTNPRVSPTSYLVPWDLEAFSVSGHMAVTSFLLPLQSSSWLLGEEESTREQSQHQSFTRSIWGVSVRKESWKCQRSDSKSED